MEKLCIRPLPSIEERTADITALNYQFYKCYHFFRRKEDRTIPFIQLIESMLRFGTDQTFMVENFKLIITFVWANIYTKVMIVGFLPFILYFLCILVLFDRISK